MFLFSTSEPWVVSDYLSASSFSLNGSFRELGVWSHCPSQFVPDPHTELVLFADKGLGAKPPSRISLPGGKEHGWSAWEATTASCTSIKYASLTDTGFLHDRPPRATWSSRAPLPAQQRTQHSTGFWAMFTLQNWPNEKLDWFTKYIKSQMSWMP